MCDHIEDGLDLYNLRLILMFLVAGIDEEGDPIRGRSTPFAAQENPNVVNVHYRMHNGGMLSAFE